MPGPAIDQEAERPARRIRAFPGLPFAADARGATSIEYALIVGLIFIVIVGSLRLFSSRVGSVYTTIGSAISQLG